MLKQLLKEIKKNSDPKRAKASQRFFKTGPGQYGEGDVFVGLTVPQMRAIAKNHLNLTLPEIKTLLHSKIHEHRLVALIILVSQFAKADVKSQQRIYKFYLTNAKRVNNWDLVDASAHRIVGTYLLNQPRDILYKLARSKNLWEKRISIIATLQFINHNHYEDSFNIAALLMDDDHDLIHKAIGWVLREVGKKNIQAEINFLDKYYKVMPRTSLRYAIERFPDKLKKFYMKK